MSKTSGRTRDFGETLAGAEIVAGKELVEASGSLVLFMERGATLAATQARWLFGDYSSFWLESMTQPGSPAPLAKLVTQRLRHVAEGLRTFSELAAIPCRFGRDASELADRVVATERARQP
ncbi:MAG: hypothetical protein AAGE43_06435 [Pseudomonadota bacterium]